jgi:TM2 domain-containing membrane protein YozV
LNQVLAPDYEVRYLRASLCTDGWCCVPLPTAAWQELEQEFGNRVDWAFTRITMPDLEKYARVEAMFNTSAPATPSAASVSTPTHDLAPEPVTPANAAPEPAITLPASPFGNASAAFSTSHPPPGGLATEARRKSKILTIFLALFLGTFGVHRLYLGHYLSALCMPALIFLSHGVLAIPVVFPWILIDIYLIATGKLTSVDGLPLV